MVSGDSLVKFFLASMTKSIFDVKCVKNVSSHLVIWLINSVANPILIDTQSMVKFSITSKMEKCSQSHV